MNGYFTCRGCDSKETPPANFSPLRLFCDAVKLFLSRHKNCKLSKISSKDLEGEIVDMVNRNHWDIV